MPLVAFYLQLHQPFRLSPERDRFLWEEKNREVFLRAAERSYLPAARLFTELIRENPDFKIALSLSGTFLEQARQYRPEVIEALQALFVAGAERRQAECLGGTYFHSLAGLFADPEKREFREQVSLHRDLMRSLFGIAPASFANTDLICTSRIADAVADMGYLSMFGEGGAAPFDGQGTSGSGLAVFHSRGAKMLVIPRHMRLSDELAGRFLSAPLSPEAYAQTLAGTEGDAVLLGCDFEHIGGRTGKEQGIFEFWRRLPAALRLHPGITVATPSEIAGRFMDRPLPDIGSLSPSVPADIRRDTFGRIGNRAQEELFLDIEAMERNARRAGGELLVNWRRLTTADHLYFLHEGPDSGPALHDYSNPYGDSLSLPAQILTRKIDDLQAVLKRFGAAKKKPGTAVLIISPETGSLPEGMGGLAKYIAGKSGGQGEVVSALCEGLTERGIDVHLATLNLKKRFQRELNMDERQWREVRYKIDAHKIHLVSSAVFADNTSAYSGDPLLTAAEFQKGIINTIIKDVRAKHEGRLIIHSHDWMAGGAITAYARATDLPVLHTVHNVFTNHVPLELLSGVSLRNIEDLLYRSEAYGKPCVDCQATAIKNATVVSFVGKRFLQEIVDDYFLDRPIVPESVRNEVKVKFNHGAVRVIMNAPSSKMYPERCEFLVRTYGSGGDVLQAKKDNLVEFQKRAGLRIDPDAILFYWPSRLDPLQKGVELLANIALPFVNAHPGVQIAVVADGVGNDTHYANILGSIACASNGRVAYLPFTERLSMLGYAAASDAFGASLYEPCGQIDQVGNLFGATATNRDTGGYHDKIRELKLRADGAPQDMGNGFLFRDYDTGGLWYALEKSLAFHKKPPEIREAQMKRIMREARGKHDLGLMIADYIRVYQKLNDGRPLI